MFMFMVRKQLYIDEELDRALKLLAARTGRSEAEHVRSALRAYVHDEVDASPDAGDPLLGLIGLVTESEGADDVAVNHDHYLYGAPRTA